MVFSERMVPSHGPEFFILDFIDDQSYFGKKTKKKEKEKRKLSKVSSIGHVFPKLYNTSKVDGRRDKKRKSQIQSTQTNGFYLR